MSFRFWCAILGELPALLLLLRHVIDSCLRTAAAHCTDLATMPVAAVGVLLASSATSLTAWALSPAMGASCEAQSMHATVHRASMLAYVLVDVALHAILIVAASITMELSQKNLAWGIGIVLAPLRLLAAALEEDECI